MRVIENKKAHLAASFFLIKFIPAGDTNFILCALCYMLSLSTLYSLISNLERITLVILSNSPS